MDKKYKVTYTSTNSFEEEEIETETVIAETHYKAKLKVMERLWHYEPSVAFHVSDIHSTLVKEEKQA